MQTPVRILHLEDNPRDAQLIRDLLDESGFVCSIVPAVDRKSFQMALAGGKYDLILCDNNLPDYDCAAALSLAKKAHPLTPIVVISGSLGEEQAVRSLHFGATDYLLKGRLERLVPAVQRALAEAEERRLLQQAELELRQNEERMRLALAATNDGIWDWDLALGRMECNESFRAAFGIPDDGSDLRTWWHEQTHPADRDDVRRSLIGAIESSASTWSRSYRMRRLDGTWAHIHNRVCLAKNSEGKVTRLVGAVQDVTESVEAETARRVLEDQLRQAQKLDAIGTLAGGIAHDFNNILGIIMNNADLARLELPPDLPQDHGTRVSLREIILASNRARDLVRQILTFSRKTETKLEVIKVQAVADECLHLLRSSIPAMVQINREIDPACASIVGDSTQVHQVIMNLCTNAWHALPESGGVITVRVGEISSEQAPPAAMVGTLAPRLVRLSITDNGHGMDAATRSRIFEPFFTTKPIGKGTGLGLAVVHGIVKSHGGSIVVTSSPGMGTSFDLYFPAHDEEPDAMEPIAPNAVAGRGQRVLLVDDDNAMGRSTQRFLVLQGYRVLLRNSPAAAIEAFMADPDAIDLVITDFSMPGMSGLELAETIRRARAEVPILLLSGSTGFVDMHRGRIASVCEFLPKPVAPDALASAVARALRSKAGDHR